MAKWREQGQRTRAEFLRAAAIEIGRRGFEAASLADIAAHVDKPRTALRYHYITKDEFATDILEYQLARWRQMRGAVDEAGLTGLQAVFALVDVSTGQYEDEPHARAAIHLIVKAQVLGLGMPDPVFGWYDLIRRLLADAQEAGEVRSTLNTCQAADSLLDASFGALAIHQSREKSGLREHLRSTWAAALSMMGVGDPASFLDALPRLSLPGPPALSNRVRSTS